MTLRLLIILSIIAISGETLGQSIAFDKNNFKKRGKELKEAILQIEQGDIDFTNLKFATALKHFLIANEFNPENAGLNYKIGKCYINSSEKRKSLGYFQKAYSLDAEVDKEIQYYLAYAYHLNNQFDDRALQLYQNFSKKMLKIPALERTTTKKEVSRKIEEYKNGMELFRHPVDIEIENIAEINSAFPDYSPVITADESVMFLTSRRPGSTGGQLDDDPKFDDAMYREDIYSSSYRKGKWTEPINIGHPVNTNDHDAGIALSNDGQILFVYHDKNSGDIYHSELIGKTWSPPKPFDELINSKYHESSMCLSPDGRMLFFVSDRPGGIGGRDIYMCKWNVINRNWNNPENIGPVINTKYDEEGIVFHPNGKTLFFSSQGHNSMGGFDIFTTTYENENWSVPENIGFPINTASDDAFMAFSANGKHAYYSSDKEGGLGSYDIYKITFKTRFLKKLPSLALLKGMVKGLKEEPLDAIILVTDNGEKDNNRNRKNYYGSYCFKRRSKNTPDKLKVELLDHTGAVIETVLTDEKGYFVFSKLPYDKQYMVRAVTDDPDVELLFFDEVSNVIAEYRTNSETGKFLISLPAGKNYGVTFYSANYLFHSENFDIPDTASYKEINKEIKLQKVEKGSKITLRNLFFDSGIETLKPESFAELDRLVSIMNQYPTLKIEIAGHTDSQGIESFNIKLSEKRAKNVSDYLIARGIQKDRVKYKGYGETKPIASNNTENGRRLNRRIEFLII